MLAILTTCPFVTLVYCVKIAKWIELVFETCIPSSQGRTHQVQAPGELVNSLTPTDTNHFGNKFF